MRYSIAINEKGVFMKKRILIISAAVLLGVSSLAFNSFATNVSNQTNQTNQESQKKERLEKPKNQVFGKITSISENSVTISLAEMKQPENGQGGFNKNFDSQGGMQRSDRGQGGANGSNNNDNNNQNQPPERKELTEEQKAEMKKNLENMFTLTGETKTIDISSAKFNDFGRGQKGGNNNSSSAANNENSNKTEKTYKDYQVGDYISIELESETSNKAKSVRDAWGMRGGMPRGDRGQGKGNGANNSNNANN